MLHFLRWNMHRLRILGIGSLALTLLFGLAMIVGLILVDMHKR
jgi:hypothetical protein